MISEFGEERILCCSCEPIVKDTSVIQSETTNLQQRINSLTQEVTPENTIISTIFIKKSPKIYYLLLGHEPGPHI